MEKITDRGHGILTYLYTHKEQNTMILFQQMLIMFLFVIAGYICGKKKVFSTESTSAFSWIIVNLANPALIINATLTNCHSVSIADLGFIFFTALILYAILILLAFVVPFAIKSPEGDRGVYSMMIVFSNIAFMGFPILNATFGSKAVLFGSAFLLPFNILIYTYGIRMMEKKTGSQKFDPKKFLNVGVCSCLAALLVYIIKPADFYVVTNFLTFMGNLALPLSMMVIGHSLLSINIRGLFLDIRLISFSLIKLILIPMIVLSLANFFIEDKMLKGVLIVISSAPVASMVPLMAQQYGGNYEQSSKGVALTTILSVFTMPLINFIFS